MSELQSVTSADERLRDALAGFVEGLSEKDKATISASVNRSAEYFRRLVMPGSTEDQRLAASSGLRAESGIISDTLLAVSMERRNKLLGDLLDVAIEVSVKAALAAL